MKLERELISILDSSRIEGNHLTLPMTLDRKTYVAVNKALELIGFKWNKSLKCHVSQSDISETLDSVINTGEVFDEKKANQFYETPNSVIDTMISLACITEQDIILEPSAGSGAILKRILERVKPKAMYYCELNTERAEECSKYGMFLDNDFLNVAPHDFGIGERTVKLKILMNPPFSKQQDISHVSHAMDIVNNCGGEIVAIMSESVWFRQNKKTLDFWEKVKKRFDYTYIELDAGTFKSSGTMVKTRIIHLKKVM